MWLASLLRIGVLKASFIPEKHIRQLIIKYGKSFVDLGEAYLMSKSKEKRIKALKSRAKYLGFNLVPLEAK